MNPDLDEVVRDPAAGNSGSIRVELVCKSSVAPLSGSLPYPVHVDYDYERVSAGNMLLASNMKLVLIADDA